MAIFLEYARGALHRAKSHFHNDNHSKKPTVEDSPPHVQYVDLHVKFIGASGLPMTDLIIGSMDPYFLASIDDKVTFLSSVKCNTRSPMWNESWVVNNVPGNSILKIEVRDKAKDKPHDHCIGKFETTVSAGEKEVDIKGRLLKFTKGAFSLKIDSHRSTHTTPGDYPYLFDGPIRYSQHFSPAVGRLTNINDTRLYCTWLIYIKGIRLFFGDQVQHWNSKYKAAQDIFQGPTSLPVRSGIQTGHRMLYAHSTSNVFGEINTSEDVFQILHGGDNRRQGDCGKAFADRVKPAVYTYIISVKDESLRFSETGAAFFVDFASKHALHSNCAQSVRYSGEFHPRPECGWANFSNDIPDEKVEWELVFDNSSGTYAPDSGLLPKLKELLEYNFPGFTIVTLPHEDHGLKKSIGDCRDFALKHRDVHNDDLEPHPGGGQDSNDSAVQLG